MTKTLTRLLGIVRFILIRVGSSGSGPRRVVFVTICLVVFAWQVDTLFLREAGVRLDVVGSNVTVVEAFGSGATVEQTFVSHVEQLDGVTVWFHADQPQSAVVRCELAADVGPGFGTLYRWVETVEVNGRTRHTFIFPSVFSSFARSVRFGLTLTTPSIGKVGIEASADDVIRPGFLAIDGQEQWGDLRFRTRSATKFRAFVASARDLPRPLREPGLALVLLAIYNWAAMTFVYYMVMADPEQW